MAEVIHELIRVKDVTIMRATQLDHWRQTDAQRVDGANANIRVFLQTILGVLEQAKLVGQVNLAAVGCQLVVTIIGNDERIVTSPLRYIKRYKHGLIFGTAEQNFVLVPPSKQDDITVDREVVCAWKSPHACIFLLPLVFASENP